MGEMAKILVWMGVVLIGLGGLLLLVGNIPGVGHLPGDIFIKKERFTFYFPITTSILFSIIVSIILMLINRK